MKKINRIGLIILLAVISLTSCSNLEDSAFAIKPADQSAIYSETFALGLGEFSTKNISGVQEWTQNSNGYVGMSGFISLNNYAANEDWLISPVIDLTGVGAANVSFDYVAHMLNLATDATLWVSETYTKDSIPSATNMTQIPVGLIPDPGNYVFTNTGQISLTKYAGKKIRIAIKYLSSTTIAGTFELKNFVVAKGEAILNPTLLYSEPLYSSMGKFTTQSVSGAQTWYADSKYSCMTMAGAVYVNATDQYPTKFANEDWLISPEVDLTSTTESYFSFDHSGKYFGNVQNEATVWVSDNYSAGLPATATWTQIYIMNYFNGFTFVTSGRLDLNNYAGKKIHIAFKYTSTTSAAGTWELRNFQVFKGQAGGVETLPLKIKDAVIYQSGSTAWVEGYVVGYAWPFLNQYAYFNSVDTCNQKLNVILADTTTNFYTTNFLAVQLPRGSLRNLLNLSQNHNRIGQKIKLFGTLSPTMGVSGMTNVTKYVLPDAAGSALPTTLLSESFSTGLGSFITYSLSGSPVWNWSSLYACATINGFVSGTRYVNDDWLISPAINIPSSINEPVVSFQMAGKYFYGSITKNCKLYVSLNYSSGSPATATWTQLTIQNYDTTDKFTFTNTGEIDISKYVGNSNVRFAIQYLSDGTTTGTGQLEIKNFNVVYY